MIHFIRIDASRVSVPNVSCSCEWHIEELCGAPDSALHEVSGWTRFSALSNEGLCFIDRGGVRRIWQLGCANHLHLLTNGCLIAVLRDGGGPPRWATAPVADRLVAIAHLVAVARQLTSEARACPGDGTSSRSAKRPGVCEGARFGGAVLDACSSPCEKIGSLRASPNALSSNLRTRRIVRSRAKHPRREKDYGLRIW
jgi:hypothetical protein